MSADQLPPVLSCEMRDGVPVVVVRADDFYRRDPASPPIEPLSSASRGPRARPPRLRGFKRSGFNHFGPRVTARDLDLVQGYLASRDAASLQREGLTPRHIAYVIAETGRPMHVCFAVAGKVMKQLEWARRYISTPLGRRYMYFPSSDQ